MRLFYYDDETENLLEEEDAVEFSREEWEEELFNLNDDGASYLGIVIDEQEKYKVKCEEDARYMIYKFNAATEEYELVDLVDFESAKRYFFE